MKIPDEILTTAKQAVLQFGRFQPSLFVHGTKAKVYIHLSFGEMNDERAAIMVQAGIKLAKDERIGDVEQVVCVSEAWASPARDNYVQPPRDQDRMEVLLFNILDAKTNAQALEMYALVRDGKRIIDLKAVPQGNEKTEVAGRLLPSFMASFTLLKGSLPTGPLSGELLAGESREATIY